MSEIRIRLVVTGACYPPYSGKQFHLCVPRTQPDGSATTVEDVEAQVRREWPDELREMSTSMNTANIKLLRNGGILASERDFDSYFSPTELESDKTITENTDESHSDGTAKSNIILHLVVQRPRPGNAGKKSSPDAASTNSAAKKGGRDAERASADATGQDNSPRGSAGRNHEVKDERCCAVM